MLKLIVECATRGVGVDGAAVTDGAEGVGKPINRLLELKVVFSCHISLFFKITEAEPQQDILSAE